MHQRDDAEPRSRFGLPPEQPARRPVLSPLRAFIILSSLGLVAWFVIASSSTGSSSDVASGGPAADVVASPSPTAAHESPPTEADVLAAFQALDGMRGRPGAAEAERVLMPGLSLRGLERAVPSGGETLEVKVLSLDPDRARLRQVVELSRWDVDLTAEDLSVGRLHRRLGIEWTLARVDDGWRMAAWTVVEDRAAVTGRP